MSSLLSAAMRGLDADAFATGDSLPPIRLECAWFRVQMGKAWVIGLGEGNRIGRGCADWTKNANMARLYADWDSERDETVRRMSYTRRICDTGRL